MKPVENPSVKERIILRILEGPKKFYTLQKGLNYIRAFGGVHFNA
jgi:hypothetical protein